MFWNFLRKEWLNLSSLVIGILGIVIGIAISAYFYNLSRSYRDPILIVDPIRTEILNTQRISEAPIQVIKSNGEKVKSDLTSLRIYFWNQGNESIRQQHILEDITITIDDIDAEIIDYRMLITSRDVTGFKIFPNPEDLRRSLIISFEILEPQDGATIQIMYEGNQKSDIVISGIIEGVNTIGTNSSIQKNLFWSEYGKNFLLALLPIVFVIIVITGLSKGTDFLRQRTNFPLSIENRFTKIMRIVFPSVLLTILLVLLLVLPISDVVERTKENVTTQVPAELFR